MLFEHGCVHAIGSELWKNKGLEMLSKRPPCVSTYVTARLNIESPHSLENTRRRSNCFESISYLFSVRVANIIDLRNMYNRF